MTGQEVVAALLAALAVAFLARRAARALRRRGGGCACPTRGCEAPGLSASLREAASRAVGSVENVEDAERPVPRRPVVR